MGVFATHCQLCALPVQQNHYIPWEGMYYIWRGPTQTPEGAPEPEFAFGPEHEWLLRAVALRLDPGDEPQVLRGEVQDGSLVGPDGQDVADCFLGEGDEDRVALHERCWELAGRSEWEDLRVRLAPTAGADVRPFQEQLFDFVALREAGLAWTLTDPQLDSEDGRRSRARIQACLVTP